MVVWETSTQIPTEAEWRTAFGRPFHDEILGGKNWSGVRLAKKFVTLHKRRKEETAAQSGLGMKKRAPFAPTQRKGTSRWKTSGLPQNLGGN